MNITGAVTFYDSPVQISNCIFIDNRSEDSLNIISSEFTIKDSEFLNSKSDALDIDFSNGYFENLVFDNSGNDGLDISGAKVKGKNCC